MNINAFKKAVQDSLEEARSLTLLTVGASWVQLKDLTLGEPVIDDWVAVASINVTSGSDVLGRVIASVDKVKVEYSAMIKWNEEISWVGTAQSTVASAVVMILGAHFTYGLQESCMIEADTKRAAKSTGGLCVWDDSGVGQKLTP